MLADYQHWFTDRFNGKCAENGQSLNILLYLTSYYKHYFVKYRYLANRHAQELVEANCHGCSVGFVSFRQDLTAQDSWRKMFTLMPVLVNLLTKKDINIVYKTDRTTDCMRLLNKEMNIGLRLRTRSEVNQSLKVWNGESTLVYYKPDFYLKSMGLLT